MSSYHSPIRKSIRWFHKVAVKLLLGVVIVGGQQMSLTTFREMLCHVLTGIDLQSLSAAQSLHSIPSTSSSKVTDAVHFLRECTEKEGGMRSDRRKRRYCIGCYESLTKLHGRNIAKKKAKRVTTECSTCPDNPRFCFACFPKYHQ